MPPIVKKMENVVNELENDEFEKLLGEIPNVTSGNSCPEESGSIINCPKDLKSSMAPDKPKPNGINERYINLPNEQAMASAFSELRVRDGAQVTAIPSPRTPHNRSSALYGYSPSIGENYGYQSGYLQTHGVQGVHLLSPIHRVDIPVIIDQHHYLLYMQQLRNQQMNRQFPNNIFPNQELSRDNNKATVSRSINSLNPRFRSTGSDAEMQYFSERILRRSSKFDSFGGNHCLSSIARNRRVFPGAVDLKFHQRSQSPECNSMEDFPGRIYLMAKDQNGCRFLQRKFAEGTPQDIEKIFPEILVHIVELMIDPFGNYLVQKLLEVCNEDQRMQVLRAITRKPGDLVMISCDMHGTRAVQKVIETLRTPEQFSMIVSSLKPGLVSLIKDMNGNHVAQRCLQYLTPEYREFLFEAAIINCVELATDRHGCCVLQKCLSQSDGRQRHRLIYEIASNALILSQDPFGNYVVQYIFDIRLPWAIAAVFNQLRGKYGDLSMQKYSSNVVEKCLKHVDEERYSYIIEELISDHRLDQIMQDPYGNYVIQAALNISKGVLHAALVEAVRAHVPILRTSPYGKKVLSCNSLKR